MLPYGCQSIDNNDIEAVVSVLKGGWLTTGPTVGEFEQKLADYVGAKYAVAVCNGTAALHLGVLAADISKGSKGVTSPNTFVASANALVYNNIKPVFADINFKTYNIDSGEIEKHLDKNTKLIIPVHFAGQPCEMKKIQELISGTDIKIIEDAAHAIGSKYRNGKRVGCCCYSDMTVFSFHPVKTMTTGEGGAITTNNKDLYEKLKTLRNHGIVKEKKLLAKNPGSWYYEMQMLGFNFRLTDIQAALGMSQLKKLDQFIQRRREIVQMYNEAFRNVHWLTIPYEQDGVYSAFHLYVLLVDFKKIKKSRKQVILELERSGIGTQVHYIPVHLQPYYQKEFSYKEGDYPRAEKYYQRCLSIPLYPTLTDPDVKKVIKQIHSLPTT